MGGLFYYEKEKKWISPLLFVESTARMITVPATDGAEHQTSNDLQIKSYWSSINFNIRKCKTGKIILLFSWILNNAKIKELDGLNKYYTWNILCRVEASPDSNIFNGWFVLTTRNEGTNKGLSKARFVVKRYKDAIKQSLTHNTFIVTILSTKILVTFSEIFSFHRYTSDITQSCLQSSEYLLGEVYLSPPKKMIFKSNQLVWLLKPLCGLAESGDYWEKFRKHYKDKISIKYRISDDALFFKRIRNNLSDLCATCVYYTLYAGDVEHSQPTRLAGVDLWCMPGKRNNN